MTKARLNSTWSVGRAVKQGDPVWQYLTNTRQLPLTEASEVWKVIRYHAKGDDGKGKPIGKFPMMLAKVVDIDGKPVGIHRTYLTHQG